MTMLVTRMVLAASVALATLIAAEAAYAQEYPSHGAADAPRHHAAPHAAAQLSSVISGNRQIGSDPDPFIRGEILRHSDSGWPD